MWMPLGAWQDACTPKGIHIPKANKAVPFPCQRKTVFNYIMHIRQRYAIPKQSEHHRSYEMQEETAYGESFAVISIFKSTTFQGKMQENLWKNYRKVHFYILHFYTIIDFLMR